jgi:hypothetical protein
MTITKLSFMYRCDHFNVILVSDNDELIGSINDLNNNISLTKRKKDARGIVGGHAKVLPNQRQSSSKSKVHTFETFDHLKRGHA